jgi:hypothetical protein
MLETSVSLHTFGQQDPNSGCHIAKNNVKATRMYGDSWMFLRITRGFICSLDVLQEDLGFSHIWFFADFKFPTFSAVPVPEHEIAWIQNYPFIDP